MYQNGKIEAEQSIWQIRAAKASDKGLRKLVVMLTQNL